MIIGPSSQVAPPAAAPVPRKPRPAPVRYTDWASI